jgi:hypothetical protein
MLYARAQTTLTCVMVVCADSYFTNSNVHCLGKVLNEIMMLKE